MGSVKQTNICFCCERAADKTTASLLIVFGVKHDIVYNQKIIIMARFVMDIANLSHVECEDVLAVLGNYYNDKVISIRCIDETNENQFYANGHNNVLSDEQIENFRQIVLNE